MIDTFETVGIKVFAGGSNLPLAEKITQAMGYKLSDMDTGLFSDGECFVHINEIVRGYDVYIIQSITEPINTNLMELLIVIDAMKRASAGRITVVVPYFAYARQDRKYSARDPISIKLVADLLEKAGVDQVITMDLHSTQIQGFFKCPLVEMRGLPLLVDYYKRKIQEVDGEFVVVAPSIGSVKRNRQLAERLNVPLAIIDSRSSKIGNGKNNKIIGDIEGKNVIMIDDIIDTGNTVCNASAIIEQCGVKSVFGGCIHPVFEGDCNEMIKNTCIEEMVILDTINHSTDRKAEGFIELSVADIFANAIISIHKNRSVSRLYDKLHEVEK